MKTTKTILDPCSGSRMMWFDKFNQLTLFGDNREFSGTLCDGRHLEIKPDLPMDFTKIPFDDGQFALVAFDPPHLIRAGKTSWIAKKYGKLTSSWKQDLKKGFSECFRVLKDDGVLIFKWNETQIPLSEILSIVDYKPLFGHRSGKKMNTHWVTFMKNQNQKI